MKKILCICLVLAIIFTFSACGDVASNDTESTQSTETSVVTEAYVETTVPTTEPIVETTAVTLPPHSELYLAEVSQEQMIDYFNEVVLDVEYSDGTGDVTLVQKWLAPIRYSIVGEPTQDDLAVMEALFERLNEISGFPGIYPSEGEEEGNLTISFLDASDFRKEFSGFLGGEEADGAVQFWYYTATNEIHTGRIGYRTDITQEIRNSVLMEELINLLGISDTVLRSDSIVYQYASEATELSEIDWVLLKLLYHPDILPGMDAQACRSILEELYH